MKKYKRLVCSYIYAPEKGDPDSGIEPGAAFEDEERPRVALRR